MDTDNIVCDKAWVVLVLAQWVNIGGASVALSTREINAERGNEEDSA